MLKIFMLSLIMRNVQAVACVKKNARKRQLSRFKKKLAIIKKITVSSFLISAYDIIILFDKNCLGIRYFMNQFIGFIISEKHTQC